MRGWLGTRCCQVLRDKYDINIWWGWPIIKKKKSVSHIFGAN
jgi:hypothetical protein